METIIVQTNTRDELDSVKKFLKEHKLRNRVLSEEDKEDIVLGKMMEDVDYSDLIETEEFIKKLRG